LLTGSIQNTTTYGEGAPYDWDASYPSDSYCRQSDVRMAYTWQDDPTSYPPGRLDYMIYSDAVMHAEKSFTLNTGTMSQERLQTYGLNSLDSANASDHFPVVTDFAINAFSASVTSNEKIHFDYFPNPVQDVLHLRFKQKAERQIRVFDIRGVSVYQSKSSQPNLTISFAALPKALYFIQIQEANTPTVSFKLIKE